MLRRTLVGFMLACLLLASFVMPAMAQDDNPPVGDGTNRLFVPFVQKVDPVLFTPPVLAMVYGAGGPVTSADVNGTYCPEILGEVSSASTDGYCVGGSQYPGFYNKESQVSGIADGDKVTGVVGAAQPYQLTPMDASLNLNGVSVQASKIFGSAEGLTAFTVDLGLVGQRMEISAASVSAVPDAKLELFRRLQNMPDNVGIKHGISVGYLTSIYNNISPIPTNLGSRCAYVMEGQESWMWYPLFGDLIPTGTDIRVGGMWGENTNPLQEQTVITCMGNYRYLGWNDLSTKPVYETWRQEILSEQDIPNTESSTFVIPQWGDTEFGGSWLVTYMSAAGGATYIIIRYVVSGVVTYANAVIVVPTKILKCAMEGTLQHCWLEDVAATTASKPQ